MFKIQANLQKDFDIFQLQHHIFSIKPRKQNQNDSMMPVHPPQKQPQHFLKNFSNVPIRFVPKIQID